MVRGMNEGSRTKAKYRLTPYIGALEGVEGRENRDGVSGDGPELSLAWDK